VSDPPDAYPTIRAALGEVTTARLDLRRPRPGDLDALAEIFAQPDVWRFPFGEGFDRARTAAFLDRQIEAWRTRRFGTWFAFERATAALVGYVGLSVPTFLPEILPAVEVGWRLAPSAWGRGYATEGARAALREAFTTLGLAEVCCIIQPENHASVRVAGRLGFAAVRTTTAPGLPERAAWEVTVLRLDRRSWSEATGAVADGAVTDGAVTDGAVTDGAVTDGAVTDGEVVDGADGATTDHGPGATGP
jgi:RimJ/RimL family protein N-acetyltransferase